MRSQTLFADVTTEVAAADLIQNLLGARPIEVTPDIPEDAWRYFDDREASEQRLAFELMADDLANNLANDSW